MDGSPTDGILIDYITDGVTVKNNIITDAAWPTLIVTGATVSGNVIEDSAAGINLLGAAKDNTISDNTITGSGNESLDIHAGTTADPTEGNTITGNIITANQTMGIRLKLETLSSPVHLVVFKDNLIEDNTISENEGDGIWLKDVSTGGTIDITGFEILNNDITDNEGDGILLAKWGTANAIKFNNITGNDTSTGDYGIQNDSDEDVDATHNWWGTTVAADIADMVNDTGTGEITYDPFLTDTVDAVFSATAVNTGAASLDAETEVGVKVSTTNITNYVISAAKYIDNPGAPLDNALVFYDVYVTGTGIGATMMWWLSSSTPMESTRTAWFMPGMSFTTPGKNATLRISASGVVTLM